MKGVVKRRIFRHRFTMCIFGYGLFFLLDFFTDILRHIKQTEEQSKKWKMSIKRFRMKFISFKKKCMLLHTLFELLNTEVTHENFDSFRCRVEFRGRTTTKIQHDYIL